MIKTDGFGLLDLVTALLGGIGSGCGRRSVRSVVTFTCGCRDRLEQIRLKDRLIRTAHGDSFLKFPLVPSSGRCWFWYLQSLRAGADGGLFTQFAAGWRMATILRRFLLETRLFGFLQFGNFAEGFLDLVFDRLGRRLPPDPACSLLLLLSFGRSCSSSAFFVGFRILRAAADKLFDVFGCDSVEG